MNKFLNKLIMYHEIQRLNRDGHSINSISEFLGINWRTVKNYLGMDEFEYEQFIQNQSDRKKLLDTYEHFVYVRLDKHQSTSAAQMHDLLKEHYPDFPEVSPKTVFNFVMGVRQKYNLPKIVCEREYMLVDELPFGKQAQVDFGQYNMRTTKGKHVKVYFFTIVLSRSRYKYVYFTDHPFTTQLSVMAHENAFAFFEGIPQEIVYDQDSVFMVDENHGDLVLTKGFNQYVKRQAFDIYFCRKADPETKGKVENVVKYVKQNFLYNRSFEDIEILNTEAIAWLHRTGNYMEHGTTKLCPKQQWELEKDHLKSYKPVEIDLPKGTLYTVRKNNSISYKSNFYSLPQGTYKNSGSEVRVAEDNGTLIISLPDGGELCRHKKCNGKGKTISNTDHKRNKIDKVNKLIEQTASVFSDNLTAKEFLNCIKKEKPRYVRDQLALIEKHAGECPQSVLDEALTYCIENKIHSAVDFISVAKKIGGDLDKNELPNEKPIAKNIKIKTLNDMASDMEPSTSYIADYENIILN